MALQAAANIAIPICMGNTTVPVAGEEHRRKSISEKGKSNSQLLVDVCLSQDCILEAVFSSKQGLKRLPLHVPNICLDTTLYCLHGLECSPMNGWLPSVPTVTALKS